MTSSPIRSLADVVRYEQQATLDERLGGARSVYDLFVRSAERFGPRAALTQLITAEVDEQPRRVTFAALAASIRRAANLFVALGGPRPGVAYLLPALVETHVVLWGAETAGYAVPLNFLLGAEELAALIRASGARVLVALGENQRLDLWSKAERVAQMLPEVKLVRVGGGAAPLPAHAVDFATAMAAQPDDRLTFGAPGRDDEVCAYFHTGGTTGAPKLVAHTHRSQMVAALGGAALVGYTETDVLPSGLPLFHVAGTIFAGLAPLMSGTEVVILTPGGFRTPAVIRNHWRLMQRYGVTLIGAVPTALSAIVDVPLDADLSAARAGFTGAASTPRAVAERFEAVSGKPLHEVLGMTEASGLIAIDPVAGERRLGSVGVRLPYTEVVVRKLLPGGGRGEACAPGEIGVLAVRGPTVSPGYRDPAMNAGVFDVGGPGWLDSGDLAYRDEAGYLYIAGRAKDLIIRGGHNIDPLMIENAMTSHPAVALAAAVGEPDAYAGELPVVYVSLRPGLDATEDDLRQHAMETVAERPAWPKRIYIVPSLPMTNVGKIYKPELRADAARRLVREVVSDVLGGDESSTVEVTPGGPRGMRVVVTLSSAQAGHADAVREKLGAYLFAFEVRAG